MSTPRDDSEERQVSEMSDMDEAQGGGADATDKSTATAPHDVDEESDQPPAQRVVEDGDAPK